MQHRKLLTPVVVEQLRAQLPDWSVGATSIDRTFIFSSFKAAWAFMSAIAEAAEIHDHHPDWRNVYNKVEIAWSTHDAGGITALDVQLALLCNRLFTEA